MVFPNKLFDYMGCGRPTVVAAEGETAAAICEGGAGLVVPPEKPEQMAAALVRLAALPASELAEMGARARRYALERFRRDRIADDLMAALRRVAP
jgi:glycosyltransferase involved in cell wall biosynthesis